MAAGVYNFTIEQGTTYVQDFYWTVGGSAVNLTGYSGRMMARTSASAPDPPLASWNSTNGRIQIGGTDGKFTLFLRDTDTAAIGWTQAVYDIELISPASTPIVTRVLKGTITIDLEVTR